MTTGTLPASARGRRRPDRAPPPPGGAERADHYERLLGDPDDARNPHGRAALLAADDRRETPAATEALLARAGLAAEFVPRELGGRLTRPDVLARVLRPLFRRDVALGFGFGITALFGAWPCGPPAATTGSGPRSPGACCAAAPAG